MNASSIIIEKLKHCGNNANIKQINGNNTNLYFVTPNTFWSIGLNSLKGNGYHFELFDILEKESYRFPNRSIPKGNARSNKLGEINCDMNTAVGIIGYLYFKKYYGESIYEPMHVISAILDWAGVAINQRGFIQFI